MAFFKYVRAGDNPSTATRPAESIEAIRQRAKHRLIGAAVLVLVGVVGFPLLFDTQPRPIPVDVQIDIPDKNKVAPLQIPAAVATPATGSGSTAAAGKPGAGSAIVVDTPAVVPAKPANGSANSGSANNSTASSTGNNAGGNESRVAAAASLDAKEQLVGPDAVKPPARPSSKPEPKAEAKPAAKPPVVAEAKPAAKPEPKAEPKPEPKADHKAEPKAEARADDGARARSLLEGKEVAKDAAKDSTKDSAKAHDDGSRFIIQVGAFADTAKAQETRAKLERAGLKTYTHVADTKDGPRTRVRLGPFTSRAEAEKAAGKVKALSLPAAILTL